MALSAMAAPPLNVEEQIMYKYVTKRWPGNASRMVPGFYVQFRGKYAGPFNSQKEAAKVASNWSGIPINSLRKVQGPPRVDEEEKGPRRSCQTCTYGLQATCSFHVDDVIRLHGQRA